MDVVKKILFLGAIGCCFHNVFASEKNGIRIPRLSLAVVEGCRDEVSLPTVRAKRSESSEVLKKIKQDRLLLPKMPLTVRHVLATDQERLQDDRDICLENFLYCYFAFIFATSTGIFLATAIIIAQKSV